MTHCQALVNLIFLPLPLYLLKSLLCICHTIVFKDSLLGYFNLVLHFLMIASSLVIGITHLFRRLLRFELVRIALLLFQFGQFLLQYGAFGLLVRITIVIAISTTLFMLSLFLIFVLFIFILLVLLVLAALILLVFLYGF